MKDTSRQNTFTNAGTDAQLTRRLASTSARLESRFDALESSLRAEVSPVRKPTSFGLSGWWLGGSLAAAVTLGFLGLSRLTVAPPTEEMAASAPSATWEQLDEIITLDTTLQSARPLLDPELVLVLLEMPYENTSR